MAEHEVRPGGDLRHGLHHLAALAVLAPGDPATLSLLERYAAANSDVTALLPPEGDQVYYGTEAIRAWFWWRAGHHENALDRLCAVTQAVPDSGFLDAWALPWLDAPGKVEATPPRAVLYALGVILNSSPEARHATADMRQRLQRWVGISERYAAIHREPGALTMIRIGLLRKAGEFERALSLAEQAEADERSWHSAVAIGLIQRCRGEVAASDAAFLRAAERDPSDVSAYLEAGDLFFNAGRWSDASARYEQALAREPDQPWAIASRLAARWRLEHAEADLEALKRLAIEGNQRAAVLTHQLLVGDLPEPQDATANMLRSIIEKRPASSAAGDGGSLRIGITSLEAPSNYLAIRMQYAAWGQAVALDVDAPLAPDPDPRACVVPVEWPLWRPAGAQSQPALPPPSPETSAAIARVAAMIPFDEAAVWAAASVVAAEIGPERMAEVLATCVHPPPIPDGSTALAWLPRVQHAAIDVAAQIDRGPWKDSVRRSALRSVLLGPQDWPTSSAIRALVRLARQEPTISTDVEDAFTLLAAARPSAGYWAWERALYQHWQHLPHLDRPTRERLVQRVAEIDAAESA